MRVRAWSKSATVPRSAARVDGSPARHGLPTWEIGPVGRHQRARAVRQDQDQAQPTLSVESAEDFERLPFKWMMSPNDPDERGTSTWVVCRVSFDRIEHAALLARLPVFTTTIRRWFKAGVVELGALDPTTMGTPQGGIISPLLANIALDGMERLFGAERRTAARSPPPAAGSNRGINLVRYADDFVVTVPSREVLEGYVIPRLDGFSPPRAGAEPSQDPHRPHRRRVRLPRLQSQALPQWQAAGRPQKEKVALHRRRLSAFFRPTGRCRRPR